MNNYNVNWASYHRDGEYHAKEAMIIVVFKIDRQLGT